MIHLFIFKFSTNLSEITACIIYNKFETIVNLNQEIDMALTDPKRNWLQLFKYLRFSYMAVNDMKHGHPPLVFRITIYYLKRVLIVKNP